ncbi:hypothetical protein RMSM_06993 [Rhodopirellula maiorica SM1]|uniref:Uncharacterized protein n=1 Tax=Rhodopirellula maiorica SM1 TaxID=1265738 RepID=M5RAJ4_9BACT|nr:DUF5989 family protein [Rhodopirellula maiorica]EMI16086.1 hypothetical protein RMSM_06993 [Rhodopirellula maiorica SM1]
MDEPQNAQEREFENQAEGDNLGFVQEFVLFLRENKKWWLVPLIGSLSLIGVIAALAGSSAAPFIYTLF